MAERKWQCNVLMPGDPLVRKLAGWKPIRCELAPGHEGNHQSRNKFGVYQWWNQEKNPQKEVR